MVEDGPLAETKYQFYPLSALGFFINRYEDSPSFKVQVKTSYLCSR